MATETIPERATRLGLDPSEHSLAIELATVLAERIDTFPESDRARVLREVVNHLESQHADRKQRVLDVLWPGGKGGAA